MVSRDTQLEHKKWTTLVSSSHALGKTWTWGKYCWCILLYEDIAPTVDTTFHFYICCATRKTHGRPCSLNLEHAFKNKNMLGFNRHFPPLGTNKNSLARWITACPVILTEDNALFKMHICIYGWVVWHWSWGRLSTKQLSGPRALDRHLCLWYKHRWH